MDSWILVLLKSIALVIITFAMVRVQGRKNFIDSPPFHRLSFIVIAMIVGALSTNLIPDMTLGLVALFVWFLLPLVFEFVSIKSKGFHDLYYGKERTLIDGGRIMEDNLLKERFSAESLVSSLRKKNVFNLEDVEFACLEPTGEVNVLLKTNKTPATLFQLGVEAPPSREPKTVILDGVVQNDALAAINLSPHWLKTKLETMQVSVDNVCVAQVNALGELYVDLFDDKLPLAQNTEREMIYATLEKCIADLESFSLETSDDVQTMYQENAKKLQNIIKQCEPLLLK